jgi:RNase adapter protein RapZ
MMAAKDTAPGDAAGTRFLVVTGLSGSGKSQAIRALEDLGYFCVDNLPTVLIPTLASLSQRRDGIPKVAIVVDVRERTFLSQFPQVMQKLRRMRRLHAALIFLEASDDALVRRFSETRRPHPLARGRSAIEGIRAERARLGEIRGMADQIIDTSDLTVHELRDAFMALSRGGAAPRDLVVTIVSFGFKHGVPAESDLVFDVRWLPNPHFVPALKRRTGRDRAVVQYMEQHQATRDFVDRLVEFLRFLIPKYATEGKSYLTVAVGCTGGRHRSVMIADTLRKSLAAMPGVRFRVRHRDIDKGNE